MHFIDIFLIDINVLMFNPLLILGLEQKGGEDFVLFRMFWLPLLDPFVFDKKGERKKKFLFYVFTPLLMIDKKGEKNLVLYACLLCMHVLVLEKAKEHVLYFILIGI